MPIGVAYTGGMEGVRLNDISTDQEAQIGSLVFGSNGTVYTYTKAIETITPNQAVCINPADGSANVLTAALVNAGRLVAAVPDLISQVTTIAAGNFFWACIRGVNNIQCIAGSTASVSAVYTTASAGALGTASAGQTQIRGIVFTASQAGAGPTASRAAVMNFPQSYLF